MVGKKSQEIQSKLSWSRIYKKIEKLTYNKLVVLIILLLFIFILLYFGIYRVYLAPPKPITLLPLYEPPSILQKINITDIANITDIDNWWADESLIVADLDNDNKLEILTAIRERKGEGYSILTAINIEDESLLWRYQAHTSVKHPSLADIDHDEKLELIFESRNSDYKNGFTVLNAEDGTLLWEDNNIGNIYSYPVIEDINDDDILEILAALKEPDSLCAFNAKNGSLLWSTNPHNTSLDTTFVEAPAVGDINDDGKIEIVAATVDNSILAFNGHDGSLIWSFETKWWNDRSPILADIDNDSLLEVIVYSGDSYIYVLDGIDGSLIWSSKVEGDPGLCQSFVIADLNSDGYLDIIAGDRSEKLHVFNGNNGKLLWSFQTNETFRMQPVVGDLDGDNNLDILIKGDKSFLYALRGYDGQLLWYYPLETLSFSNVYMPLYLCDTDQDQKVEFILYGTSSMNNQTFIWIFDFPQKQDSGFRIFWQSIGGDFQRRNNVGVIDPDHDFLSTYSEEILGTDPQNKDTDSDKLPDSYELIWTKTNPLTQDSNNNGVLDSDENTDNDKLSNFEEYQTGTDPLTKDTDHDFLPDGWDLFPFFPDTILYVGFLLVVLTVSILYILKIRKKKKNVTKTCICKYCNFSSNELDTIFCPNCGERIE